MREIKFKVWNKLSGKMSIVEKLSFNQNLGITDIVIWTTNDGNNFHSERVLTNECEIMEYTGLKDKNGKEIYEGDIIKYSDNKETPEYTCTRLVEWNNGCFVVTHLYHTGNYPPEVSYPMCVYRYTLKAYYEVIGNIYEDPTLMEEKEKIK